MKITKPNNIRNTQYHFIGIILLFLNYIRNNIVGYKTPRTFSIDQIERAIEYDFGVTEGWIRHLSNYLKQTDFLKDKIVLELCPGPDLGTGLVLLAAGAKKYIALDVNKLAASDLKEFYSKFFVRLRDKYPRCDVDYLKEQLNSCYRKEKSNVNYIVDKKFQVSKIKDKIDIVFSQAAFEHFSDLEETFRDVSSIVKKGGVLVAEVDLKTHTRWIRDKDPLNIYRHNDFLWNLLKFKGSPNRARTFEYKKLLEKNGWFDIQIVPQNVLEDEYVGKVKPTLYKRFRNMNSSEMRILSFMLIAKKG